MNAGLELSHASFEYYDSDYPSEFFGPIPENFDATTERQGVARDVRRYLEIAGETGGPVLEMCCGTGRVCIPLARNGFDVMAVDLAPPMIEQLRSNLAAEPAEVRARVDAIEGDATRLSLEKRDFPLVIIAFNSLLVIPDGEAQIAALRVAAAHMADAGRLVIDVVNPLRLEIGGDPIPKPFFTRRNVHTGCTYTRFAMMGPFDVDQRQRLHGWYDEINEDGTVRRTPYSMHWRPVFRFELELMLRAAGLRIASIEGGHNGETFCASSPSMFVQAVKET